MPELFKRLKIGTDCELFLVDAETKEPVPVVGLLGGTKESPRPVLAGDGFFVQEDNVMPEFNIPACADPMEWEVYLRMMAKYLKSYFAERKLEIVASASMEFPQEKLNTPQAQMFGCEPDYNAWTLEENEVPAHDPKLRNIRTAGGHIHISYTKAGQPPQLEDQILLVKCLDLTLGAVSATMDKDLRRRKMYGKMGAFRPKPYGVEYRVLSNYWMRRPLWRQGILEGVRGAFRLLNSTPTAQLEPFLDKWRPFAERALVEGEFDTRLSKNVPVWFPTHEEPEELWTQSLDDHSIVIPNA